jgi:hypothetical protein
MAHQWTRVVLKGRAQVIPSICPICLGAADQKIRYGYKGLEGWLTRTTYYQTFAYCEACHPQVVSATRLRRWGYFGVVVGCLALIPILLTFSSLLKDPATGKTTDAAINVGMAVAGLLSLGIAVLIYWVARTLKRRRHPLRPGQAVWGPGAFYTGSARMGLSSGTAVYRAARPEWAAALLKANPEQVDDATYQALTGAARPTTTPDSRPFGPA